MDVEDLAELPTSVLVQRTLALARSEPVLQSDDDLSLQLSLVAGARNTLHLEFPWLVAELPAAS